VRVAFAGTPEFALAPLRALVASHHKLVGVLTQPDRPAGRGRKLAPSVVKEYALQQEIALDQPVSLRTAQSWSSLQSWAPDILVVVAYGLILPAAVLGIPRLGCLNIHASLLPRWRGAAPIQRAILAGDAHTGVSIMQMDAGLDTGPVWLMRETEIRPRETASELQSRLAELGANALLDVLEQIERGDRVPNAQSEQGMTYASKIEKAEAMIDWSASALAIERKVRAFESWPVAETRMAGEQWRIHRARYLPSLPEDLQPASDPRRPGQLLGLARVAADASSQNTVEALVVACGEAWLGLEQLQRAGKRRLPARDFWNALPSALAQGVFE